MSEALLDELLDELEADHGMPGAAKLQSVLPREPTSPAGPVRHSSSAGSLPDSPPQRAVAHQSMVSPETGELDELLDDLSDLAAHQWPSSSNGSRASAAASVPRASAFAGAASAPINSVQQPFRNASGLLKCRTPALGPEHSGACSNMRCTDCDFAVVAFQGFAWGPDTDYLFLRNNMPDFHKLRRMLVARPASRAYACQCQCESVTRVEAFAYGQPFKWVCGGHD